MDIDKLKNLLRTRKLSPNATYGQNFLVDDEVLTSIVDAAGITPDDVVVEIGPGIGNLTRELLARSKFVLSIEKDPKFQPILYSIKKDHRESFRYEIADALEFDYQTLLSSHSPLATRHSYKVVANIPYYITGKILQMFMTAEHKPSTVVVLTQKEVAQNVIAEPGDLNLLGISVQIYGKPELIKIVPAKSFYPAPKVDSAILKITLPKKPLYNIADEKKFFKILKACFAGKRKQLHNTLTNNLQLPKEKVLEILSALNIDPGIRPQALTIEQWVRLSEKIL